MAAASLSSKIEITLFSVLDTWYPLQTFPGRERNMEGLNRSHNGKISSSTEMNTDDLARERDQGVIQRYRQGDQKFKVILHYKLNSRST